MSLSALFVEPWTVVSRRDDACLRARTHFSSSSGTTNMFPPFALVVLEPPDLRLRDDAVQTRRREHQTHQACADDEPGHLIRGRQRSARHRRASAPGRRPRAGRARASRRHRNARRVHGAVTSPKVFTAEDQSRGSTRGRQNAGGSIAKRFLKLRALRPSRPRISRAQPLCPVCCPLATGDSYFSHFHDGRTRRHGGPRCLAPRSRRRREEKGRRLRRPGSRRASPRPRASLRDAPTGNRASFPCARRTPFVASQSVEANTPGAPA